MLPRDWIPFRYRDFYDVPRMMVFEQGGALFLLSCRFDNDLGDYSDSYVLYRLPKTIANQIDLTADWSELEDMGERIGEMPLAHFEFDATRRKTFRACA